MIDKEYSNKILELVRRFTDTKDEKLVTEACKAYVDGDYLKVEEIYTKLCPEFQLLESLIEKLKGKSVHTNLKKIFGRSKHNVSEIDQKIALSSLFTHCCIESKTDTRYIEIGRKVLDKLNQLILI